MAERSIASDCKSDGHRPTGVRIPLGAPVVTCSENSPARLRANGRVGQAHLYLSFGHLKDELDYKTCTTFEELRSTINEYMRYYNQERKQWERKKMTPVEYRNHLLAH